MKDGGCQWSWIEGGWFQWSRGHEVMSCVEYLRRVAAPVVATRTSDEWDQERMLRVEWDKTAPTASKKVTYESDDRQSCSGGGGRGLPNKRSVVAIPSHNSQVVRATSKEINISYYQASTS